MTVVTRQRSENFALIPNAVAEDERLTFEARGLLCYLLAKPNNWKVVIGDIQRAGGIGRDKAYKLLKELRETGYVHLDVQRDANKRISSQQYVVYDCAIPERLPLPEKPEMAKPLPEKPEQEKPFPEKPASGVSGSGKPGRYNKNPFLIKTHPPLPPSGFDALWEGWPLLQRPDSRKAAETAFAKLPVLKQQRALNAARSYCDLQTGRRQIARMISYLKDELFEELFDAPPIDRDGEFIITPERPEWPAWVRSIRETHGPAAVQSVERQRRMVRKARWPAGHVPGAEQQLSMEMG